MEKKKEFTKLLKFIKEANMDPFIGKIKEKI